MPDKLIGAASAAKRFRGARATGYDARRSVRPHWAKEHAAVEKMLADLPQGSVILDIPVGTGRYAAIYKMFGFKAFGVDSSEDMLAEAMKKIAAVGADMTVWVGDALAIRADEKSFDAVVCTRLVNWFLTSEMDRAIFEMVRVMRGRLIISVEFGERTQESGNNPHSEASFAAALALAGSVEKRRIEIDPGYFMIEAVRA